MPPVIHPSCFIHPAAHVIGDVTLERDVSLWVGTVLRGDLTSILVEEGTNIQDYAVVHVDPHDPARIGRGCTIGHGAVVHGCTIGDECLIGIKAVIRPSCRIGDFCTVAAGTVVEANQSIPPESVLAGMPARRVPKTGEFIKIWTRVSLEDRLRLMAFIRKHLTRAGKQTISDNAHVDPTAVLVGEVEIGENSIVKPGAVLRGDFGKITIGRNTTINEYSVLHAGDPADIMQNRVSALTVGDRVTIGRRAVINGRRIENDVTIEDDAFVLHGATIRKNCTILAGSGVMTGMEVPPGNLVSGLPGKILPNKP